MISNVKHAVHDFHNGGCLGKTGTSTWGRGQPVKCKTNMAPEVSDSSVKLSENDIPGASLCGRKPEELKTDELKFWLRCRGDNGKGLKTKAQLVKRYVCLHLTRSIPLK